MKGIVIQNVGATMAIAIEAQISLLNFYHSKICTTVRSVQEIPNYNMCKLYYLIIYIICVVA